MSGLQKQLTVGFGGLLALLLVVGSVSLYLLTHYSHTVVRVFNDNYKSVVYGQSMKDAINQIDDLLQSSLIQGTAHADAEFVRAHDDFESNLKLEQNNITVPGEREVVAELDARWRRYTKVLAMIRAIPLGDPTWRTQYRNQVFPAGLAVREESQRVITLNLDSIISADGEIRQSATSATRTMYALLAAGVVLAIALIVVFMRSILAPLRTLTGSAREIERGNLDLVVTVPTDGEIGQLAEAFNSMAGKLRETRRSDRLKIIRAQRTTQLALDSLPDAIAIISADGRIDLANHTAQRLFRLRSGIALASVDQPRLLEVHAQVLATGQAFHPKGFETAIQVFDHEERFFLPHALPIVDSDGQPAGVTLVLADITGLRRLDEMKSNLLAVVSHELKTPLTGLRMATHLLLDERTGPLTPMQADLAMAARDDSDRLNTIVNGLLDISRIESGRALMELARVAPQRLVDHAVEAFRAAYRDKGVALGIDLPGDLPEVMADSVRIDHVFSNLLDNALKYTPSGGRVTILASAHDAVVEFSVEDTGIGIPADQRTRIFERFYRIPGQTNVGAGLGLAIAKEIVHAHGGDIWLEDQVGPGSTFCFTIPSAADKKP